MNEVLRSVPSAGLVLDLGSARGSFESSSIAARTIRTDLHLEQIERGGCFVLADASRLPFRARSFDAVIANHSLEHFEDLQGSLREIGRVVKPGGALFITVPDSAALTDRLYRHLARGGGHVNAFRSAEDLAAMVERNTDLPHAATRTLCTSLAFLNRRNRTAPSPRRLRWAWGDREAVLLAVNTLFRLIDLLFKSRCAVYGWALYFGHVCEPVDAGPWINVCVRCGNAHPSAWLQKHGSLRRLWRLLPAYACPVCGAVNMFWDDRDFVHLRCRA
jgi:SAM-dependent methyltransferase